MAVLSYKNVKRAETVIGIGVLCYTTLNYAMNPAPFLVASGCVIGIRLGIKVFQNTFDKENKYKEYYSAMSQFAELVSEFVLFYYSSQTYFLGFVGKSVLGMFGVYYIQNSLMPAIIIDISNTINETVYPSEKKDEPKDFKEEWKDGYKNLLAIELMKNAIWSGLRFFVMPQMIEKYPDLPESFHYILLRTTRNIAASVLDNLPDLRKVKFSSCLIDAFITLGSVEIGLASQALGMQQQLGLPKEVYFISAFALSLVGMQKIKKNLSKDPAPKNKGGDPQAESHVVH